MFFAFYFIDNNLQNFMKLQSFSKILSIFVYSK